MANDLLSGNLATLANIMARFFTKSHWRRYTGETLDKFLPQTQYEETVKYQNSNRIRKENLPTTDGLKHYETSQKEASKTLFDTITNLNKHNPEVKAAIDSVLEYDSDITAATHDYESEMKDLIRLSQDDTFQYTALNMIALFSAEAKKAEDAMKAHLERQLQRLDNAFGKDGALSAVLKSNVDEHPAIKEAMRKELIDEHTKAVAAFNKQATAAQATMTKDANARALEIALLATLYQQAKNRDELNKLRNASRQGVELAFGHEEEGHLFAAVRLGNLPYFTLSGLPLQKSIAGEKATFTIQLPHHLNFKYYYSRHHHTKADLISLIQAARASDPTAVGNTMHINSPDHKNADELARLAYEACLEQGYKPNEITININGVEADEKKIQSLFEHHPSAIEEARKKGDQYRAHKATELPVSTDRTVAELKNQIRLRREEEAEKAALTPTAPDGSGRLVV